MVKQVDYEGNIEEVNPQYQFEQADANEDTFAAIFVWTPEFVKASGGDTDDDISPDMFPDLFDEVQEGEYVLKNNDQFLFHDICYASWGVAPKIGNEFSIGEEVDFNVLKSVLAAAGFEECQEGFH